jgi:DNA-binding response OmpR family regulator
MERLVLIVEQENDFALSMASVLHDAGYTTTMAQSAADAQRELEKRLPDLVILRAELPDQSGFVLCGTIRKGVLVSVAASLQSVAAGPKEEATAPGEARATPMTCCSSIVNRR